MNRIVPCLSQSLIPLHNMTNFLDEAIYVSGVVDHHAMFGFN